MTAGSMTIQLLQQVVTWHTQAHGQKEMRYKTTHPSLYHEFAAVTRTYSEVTTNYIVFRSLSRSDKLDRNVSYTVFGRN